MTWTRDDLITYLENLAPLPEQRKAILQNLLRYRVGDGMSTEDIEVCVECVRMIDAGDGGAILPVPVKREVVTDPDLEMIEHFLVLSQTAAGTTRGLI